MSVRLDKWLWAARFYKTRSLAKQAIAGGKVHVDGQRAKPGKAITAGIEITARQGFSAKTVVVLALSEQRGPALQAQQLYQETAASISKRELQAQERKDLKANKAPEHKPDKKQRRQLLTVKRW